MFSYVQDYYMSEFYPDSLDFKHQSKQASGFGKCPDFTKLNGKHGYIGTAGKFNSAHHFSWSHQVRGVTHVISSADEQLT